MPSNSPVVLSGALYALGNAIIALVVGMGWYTLTAEQVALWNGALSALILVGTYFVQKYTTPRSNPTASDGAPLVRGQSTKFSERDK